MSGFSIELDQEVFAFRLNGEPLGRARIPRPARAFEGKARGLRPGELRQNKRKEPLLSLLEDLARTRVTADVGPELVDSLRNAARESR